ncbi:MAG: hypothetical protein K6A30_00160 [Lachnospiraceae bacterium]|nr:hypothetical protein [Lachnospiraceae bacterium]
MEKRNRLICLGIVFAVCALVLLVGLPRADKLTEQLSCNGTEYSQDL